MPGPNRAPRGGYQKPKDLGKTISRLLGYLTRSKLPLMAVFGCLLISDVYKRQPLSPRAGCRRLA